MVKELGRFNWWLIYNLISNSVGNLMISVLRANLWASTVSSHLPQNQGSFASGAEYEEKEQDILLLSCNSADSQRGTTFSMTFGLISIGEF